MIAPQTTGRVWLCAECFAAITSAHLQGVVANANTRRLVCSVSCAEDFSKRMHPPGGRIVEWDWCGHAP